MDASRLTSSSIIVHKQAILFYVFDVIIHRGRSLRHVRLGTKRELLSDIAADLKTHTPLIGFSDTLDTTPAELIP